MSLDNLSILRQRLEHVVPDECHEEMHREISQYELEVQRMASEKDEIGQATLTSEEIRKLKTTNQYSNNGSTVIQWQCVKAAAIKYNVEDWLSKIDQTLHYSENIELMKREGEAYR